MTTDIASAKDPANDSLFDGTHPSKSRWQSLTCVYIG